MKTKLIGLALSICIAAITPAMADDFTTTKFNEEQGDKVVQYNLGVDYYEGEGISQDESAAKECYGKACDNVY